MLRCLLLDKSLNLPAGSQYFLDFGRLSTLITSDLQKFTSSIMARSHLYTGPCLLVLYTIILWLQISWVSLFAPVIIISIALVQNSLNTSLFKLNKEKMAKAQERGSRVAEIVAGIKVIKFNSWEKYLIEKISKIRLEEKRLLFKMFWLKGLSGALSFLVPVLCSLVCFSVY